MCRDLQHATPSLADLVQQVLGRQLRQEGVPHNCERDALAAMELVLHGLQHGCRQDLIPPATQVIGKALYFSCLLPFHLYCMHYMTCVGATGYSGIWPSLAVHVELDPWEQAQTAHVSWAK